VQNVEPEFYARLEKEFTAEEFDAMLRRPLSDCVLVGLTKDQFRQCKVPRSNVECVVSSCAPHSVPHSRPFTGAGEDERPAVRYT
jgi:hypothetical protein